MLQLEVLVGELVPVDALAACAVVIGEVVSLAHEPVDDMVEHRPGVPKPLFTSAQGPEYVSGPEDNVDAEIHGDVVNGRAADGGVEVDLGVTHLVRVGDCSDCGTVNGVVGWRGCFMRQNIVLSKRQTTGHQEATRDGQYPLGLKLCHCVTASFRQRFGSLMFISLSVPRCCMMHEALKYEAIRELERGALLSGLRGCTPVTNLGHTFI